MPTGGHNELRAEFEKRADGRAKFTVALLRAFFSVSSRIAPRWTAARALDRFLDPPRPRRPERERAWLESAEPGALRVDGLDVRCWSWSPDGVASAAVLLMHGWGGRGAQLGAFVSPLLEKGFRVVTLDAPGHGDSSGSRSSLPALASAVEAAAAAFGPFFAVIGHSAGAVVTTYAVAHGLEVERLVYVSSPADPGRFPRLFGEFLGLTPRARELLVDSLERRVGLRVDEFYGPKLAAGIDRPLLAVHDREDPEVLPENAEILTGAWAGSRLHWTTGLGHRRILRDPAVIEEAVSFLTLPPERRAKRSRQEVAERELVRTS